jgi:hypothetical protein
VMRKSEILFHAFYFGAFKTNRQTAKAQLEALGFRFVLLTIGMLFKAICAHVQGLARGKLMKRQYVSSQLEHEPVMNPFSD